MKNKNVEKKYEVNLFKKEIWWNPLSVTIGYNSYELDKIYFYNENGIVYVNSRGWFGDNSFNVFFKTSKEIKKKTKINFSNRLPFIIRSKIDYPKRYDLYLPIEDFDLKVSYYKYSSMIMQKVEFYDEHNQLCKFENCIKYLEDKLFNIQEKYQEHLKNINNLRDITEMYFLDEIETLKGLAKEYYKEKQNIENYTVEDYLKEINEN